jgi:uncharacterized delta-60 repeat protein
MIQKILTACMLATAFNASGQSNMLDPAFGVGGIVRDTLPGITMRGWALKQQPDEKIVEVGITYIPDSLNTNVQAITIARYMPNGVLDPTFGSNGRFTDVPHGTVPCDLIVQPDGRILTSGSWVVSATNWHLRLLRLLPDGTLDSAYGMNGNVLYDINGNVAAPVAMALQPDGKLLVEVSNVMQNGAVQEFHLLRFTASGVLDSTFATNGIMSNNDVDQFVGPPVVQSDGKIVCAWGRREGLWYTDPGVVRYLADGALDTTFGVNGFGVKDLSQDEFQSWTIGLAPDDGLIISGMSQPEFDSQGYLAFVRFHSDGTLDSSFGTNGISTAANGFGLRIWNHTVQFDSQGRIVAAGIMDTLSPVMFFAARALPDGSWDSTFGDAGWVDFPLDVYDGAAYGSPGLGCLQADDKVLIAGETATPTSQYGFAAVRLLAENPTSLSGELAPNDDPALASPNPFSSSTTITCPAPSTARDLRLRVMDLQGRVVEDRRVSNQGGRVNETITSEGKTDGVYLCRVLADGAVLGSTHLVVQR